MNKINDSLIELDIKKRRSGGKSLLFFGLLTLILLVVILLNNFVYFNVRVSGTSMDPTLYGGTLGSNDGDILVANRLKSPKRGDIVIIDGVKVKETVNGVTKYEWIIKRVIALEGDTVEIKDGFVYLNGESLDEPYLEKQGLTVWKETGFNEGKPYTLKEGEVFYLGDNRERSSDSRDKTKGVCTLDNVIGVVEDWSVKHKELRRKIYAIPEKIASWFTGD